MGGSLSVKAPIALQARQIDPVPNSNIFVVGHKKGAKGAGQINPSFVLVVMKGLHQSHWDLSATDWSYEELRDHVCGRSSGWESPAEIVKSDRRSTVIASE